MDPDGPYQKTIEFIKFDSKTSAENMTVDSAEKRHMLSAAVTHYENVTTSLLDLRRRGVDENYLENVRALCVKIAMDPQNISVDLRELKDICTDLESSNADLYRKGYWPFLGMILRDVNSYDLNSNTTANNTNLKSVQKQLFELAKPSDVPESKSLEDLLAEKTDSYPSACSFFEGCGVQPEIKEAIQGNAWMADQIFERLEQHIENFGLDNFIYKDGNIANLGNVTTAFANSLSALLPDGFEVDLTKAKTVTPAKQQSEIMKSALERASPY